MNKKSLFFAGGCFWGVQAFARRLPGVVKTTCGYANGTLPHPSYEDVCTGQTGHAAAVQILYDADVISLPKLAEELFSILHPTCKSPSQYRSGFYYDADEDGRELAQVWEAQAAKTEAPLTVECGPLTVFYPAEEYHQDYLEHHPDAFCHVDLSRFGMRVGSSDQAQEP